jgi:histone H3/H4
MAAKRTTKKTAKKKTAKKTTKKNTQEMLLVGSKVKAALKEHDLNVAGDALEGLNDWIYFLIDQAANRAANNGRKTVRAHDFMSR